MDPVPGIHHVTAVSSDPRRTVEFYSDLLGLRLVKRTVNFDDPGTYHLYFGDDLGRPGTILTFFPWLGARAGRKGFGLFSAASFSVPRGSLDPWRERLRAAGVAAEMQRERFGERALAFTDPDGLGLELVESARDDPREGWTEGPLPPETRIRGFHSVTLLAEGYASTAELLESVLGFRDAGAEGARHRFDTGSGAEATLVDVVVAPEAAPGLVGAGSFHHVAWRAKDDATQHAWRARLAEQGVDVTPVIDRQYFRSIYFREPGGALFEIATDPPGFGVDEPVEALGERLMLPPRLEPLRARIENALPPLRT